MAQLLLDPDDVGQPTAEQTAHTRLPPRVRKFGYLPDIRLWQPGDLLLFSAVRPDFLQRQIVVAQERVGCDGNDARWHHAAVYVGNYYLCESVPGGVRYRSITEFVPDYKIRVRRDTSLNIQQAFGVVVHALKRLNTPYSLKSAVWVWILSWTRIGVADDDSRFRRPATLCSQLYDEAYAEATNRLLAGIERQHRVLPADLSACDDLSDVQSAWAPLP